MNKGLQLATAGEAKELRSLQLSSCEKGSTPIYCMASLHEQNVQKYNKVIKAQLITTINCFQYLTDN